MICVSLVSHGHGSMVTNLAKQLLTCSNVSSLIITLNIPEAFPEISDVRLQLIENVDPKGFGENHNAAFKFCKQDYFCVINPDIVLVDDPFLKMLEVFGGAENVGLVAPLVLNSAGMAEDSMRFALTPWSLLKRLSGLDSGAYAVAVGGKRFSPDWVAGMLMLFKSSIFSKLDGFDERYFMYCEDVDICTRLVNTKYKIVACLDASVIHNAQRESHHSFSHLRWHLKSMCRYFLTHSFNNFKDRFQRSIAFLKR